jgi:hypothetical protein
MGYKNLSYDPPKSYKINRGDTRFWI